MLHSKYNGSSLTWDFRLIKAVFLVLQMEGLLYWLVTAQCMDLVGSKSLTTERA